MSRYIDADKLYVDWYDSFVADDGTEHDNIPLISKGQIDDAPSIDIVRCGECKKRKKNKFCLEHKRYEKDDEGFCSYGERREP